jgi:hypothetical protein
MHLSQIAIADALLTRLLTPCFYINRHHRATNTLPLNKDTASGNG